MQYLKRKHPRLKEYDYRLPGMYFITVCTDGRIPIFGAVLPAAEGTSATVCLSALGEIADAELNDLPQRYPYVKIERSVIMPNHVHFLLSVTDAVPIEKRIPVPHIVGVWKSRVTKACKVCGYSRQRVFQASFHDHVIRNERDYQEIWSYIENNPQKWALDRYYTD